MCRLALKYFFLIGNVFIYVFDLGIPERYVEMAFELLCDAVELRHEFFKLVFSDGAGTIHKCPDILQFIIYFSVARNDESHMDVLSLGRKI